jgi:hypothetical protein
MWNREDDSSVYEAMIKSAVSQRLKAEKLANEKRYEQAEIRSEAEESIDIKFSGILSELQGAQFLNGPGKLCVSLSKQLGEYKLCDAAQNALNQEAIATLNIWAALAKPPGDYVDTFDDTTNDLDRLRILVEEHDNVVGSNRFSYYECSPSFQGVQQAYTNWATAYNNSLAKIRWGVAKVYGNAQRQLQSMQKLMLTVKDERTKFESRRDGGDAVAGITTAHDNFAKQENVVRAFKLWNIKDGNTVYDPAHIFSPANDVHREELNYSTITELDRLRDEYAVRARPVPFPSEFTATAHTAHFSFRQLNTGDYNWAILRNVLLANLEVIYEKMTASNLPVQLNSVYRNPARADGLSRHQYGDAVDLQVFDNNHDGNLGDDWKQLAALVQQTRPSYLEPMAQSGAGHVHLDWRNYMVDDFSASDVMKDAELGAMLVPLLGRDDL